jgi:hypothetical protein
MIRDPSDGSVTRDERGAEKPTAARRAKITALKERYGDNWGINPPPDMPAKKPYRVLTAEELSAFYHENPERIMRLRGDQGGDDEQSGI